MATISKKICLVGDFCVGKTSLIRRFVDGQFSDQYLSTVGVKISKKILALQNIAQSDKLNVQLLVWDLEGHTKFKAIAPTYLQGSSAAVVVADVTRPETIERIPEHIKLFFSINPKGFVIVALNKSDLLNEENLAKLNRFEDGDKILATYHTSAKTGNFVDEIFEKLAYRIIQP